MSRVRFATAKALFDTFPETYKKIGAKPTDQFPIDFLKGLVSQAKLDDAVTFCAYLLPRREAVWWACGCVRAHMGDIPQNQAAGIAGNDLHNVFSVMGARELVLGIH